MTDPDDPDRWVFYALLVGLVVGVLIGLVTADWMVVQR